MKTWALAVGIGGLAMLATPAAAAPTVGDTVTCASTAFSCSSRSATMGAGTEFTGNQFGFQFLSFDFSDGLLKIRDDNWTFGFVGNLSFDFEDLGNAFNGVTLMSSTGFSNLSQANFAVNNGVLAFSSTSFSATPNAEMVLRVSNVGAVPEPAAWTMMILGFGMAGYALRQRRKGRVVTAA